jgi:hypothetical protein
MMLKRKHDGGRCTGVQILHTGLKPQQNFSHRLIEQAMAEGWADISGNTLTLHADPEPLVYTLKRTPGYYCTSTGERIPISEVAWGRMRATGNGDLSRRDAVAWLAAHGKAQDDYDVTWAYECELQPEQHARWRAVTAVSGNVVAACRAGV